MKTSSIALGLLFLPALAHAQDEAARKATVAYLKQLQTTTGGFLSMPPQPNIRLAPTLRATSAAIRALHLLDAEVPNIKAARDYVLRCRDERSGGFGDMPGREPDVFTSAVGIMAAGELGLPMEKYRPPLLDYLRKKVKHESFDDIRIAVAGWEHSLVAQHTVRAGGRAKADAKVRAAARQASGEEIAREIRKMKGSGLNVFYWWKTGISSLKYQTKGDGAARQAGGLAVTKMRMGRKIEGKERADLLSILHRGQGKDGGFGKEGAATSDLESTYRVMRCFMMLDAAPPDPKGLRAFIASCRKNDGGYAITPEETSGVGPTYFAVISQYWLDGKR